MIPLDLQEILAQASGSGFYTREHGLAVFEVRGTDGLDLLHRLSTNDLLSGSIPRSVNTVFTTEKGRVVDLAEVTVLESRILLTVHAGAASKVREWIARFTILEEIELFRVTDDLVLYYILGSQLHSSIRRADELRLNSIAGRGDLICWRSDLGGLPGIQCLVPAHLEAEFIDLQSRGGSTQLDGDSFDLIRIMASFPAYPNELNEGIHPLEVGLRKAVSFTKGCYVGQEVVARLDAYDKVKRELFLLRIREGPRRDGTPWYVRAGGTVLGECTSVSPPLTDGTTFALALCTRKELQDTPPTLAIQGGEIEYTATIEPPYWPGSPGEENR